MPAPFLPPRSPGPEALPEDKTSVLGAMRDTIALDTSFGQALIAHQIGSGLDVPLFKGARRIVPGYTPFTDPQTAGLQDRFLPELVGSGSPEETAMLLQQIELNTDLRSSLEDYGGTRFVSGFLDPINLIPVPFVLGKGALAGLKRAITAGAPIVGATEVARHKLDPTSTAEETFFNIGGGILFMGAIGGLAGRYVRNPDAITAGEAVQRALDTIVPLDKPIPASQTNAFAGFPPWAGTIRGAFNRHLHAIKSIARQGDDVGTRHKINLLHGKAERLKKNADGIDSPLEKIGGRVHEGPEGYPLGYEPTDGNPGGVITARKIHDIQVRDLAKIRERIKNKELLETLSEQTGQSKEELVDVMQGQIDDLAKRVDDGETFFARDDVIKQERLEIELADTPNAPKRQLDDFELVKDKELDIINGVPSHIRAELREFTEIGKRLRSQIKGLNEKISALERGIEATNSKSHKTRKANQIKRIKEDRQYLRDNLARVNSRVNGTRRFISDMNAVDFIKDWDLLPAAFNTILGKLRQFPYWHLIKNEFRGVSDDLDPTLGADLQLFSLQTVGSPGLSNRGNALGRTAGASIENMAQTWQGPFIVALKAKNRAYSKYLGLGEDTTMFNNFWIDTKQRVRSSIRSARFGTRPETLDGKLTMEAWNREVSRGLITGEKHAIKEVNESITAYRKVFDEMGKEGRELGIFWTQKNAEKVLGKIQSQLDNINTKLTAKPRMKKALQKQVDDLELEKLRIEGEINAYKEAGSPEIDTPDYFHRMWRADRVRSKKQELIELLESWFLENPKVRRGDEVIELSTDPIEIRARAEEAYSSILREADTFDTEFHMNSIDKREWLEVRLVQANQIAAMQGDAFGIKVAKARIPIIQRKLDNIRHGEQTVGGAGPLIQRQIDIPNSALMKQGFIEMDVDSVVGHYVSRMGPAIETARRFGDIRAGRKINELHTRMVEAANRQKNPGKRAHLLEKAEQYRESMTDIIDITQGIYQIPDDPAAITGRTLRILRNFNVLTAMGRATLMALADTGNVIISQGFTNTFGALADRWTSGALKGNIRMMDNEIELAGSVVEVALGMRYHQFTEIGASWFAATRLERNVAEHTQRFFLLNLMGPWTDMMKKVAGGMIQSKMIENAQAWKAGKISAEDAKIMTRLGFDRERAFQLVDQWEGGGKLMHKKMFIANTEQWSDDILRREFRAAINNETARAVITPGAADKPKALLKSEWWKVFGQYKGFSISASHRILGAGLQQKGAQKYAGFASMIGIAMMVDMWKRPDYINLSPQEQVLRAVELSGVTGVLLDLNDTIERATAGAIGIRPMLDMDIRERNPTWATQMGASLGAVPNQWLQMMWALTSEEADTSDMARITRYMMPYNNIFYWKTVFDRGQRGVVELVEDEQ